MPENPHKDFPGFPKVANRIAASRDAMQGAPIQPGILHPEEEQMLRTVAGIHGNGASTTTSDPGEDQPSVDSD